MHDNKLHLETARGLQKFFAKLVPDPAKPSPLAVKYFYCLSRMADQGAKLSEDGNFVILYGSKPASWQKMQTVFFSSDSPESRIEELAKYAFETYGMDYERVNLTGPAFGAAAGVMVAGLSLLDNPFARLAQIVWLAVAMFVLFGVAQIAVNIARLRIRRQVEEQLKTQMHSQIGFARFLWVKDYVND